MIPRFRRPTLAILALLVMPVASGWADDAGAALYVRTDTDGTTVYSPSARGQLKIVDDATSLELAYAADIWTSASIDVRSAASRIVSEQRDELSVGVARELVDLTLAGSYRLSVEPDYQSHGGALSVEQRLADGNATFQVGIRASQDSVGRSGEESFDEAVSSVGATLALTQVLDRATVVQVGYELTRREGYQASPYRFVGVGGDGLCDGSAQLCVPETHPGVRTRHAASVQLRRALGPWASAGLGYRFYVDDWGIVSHTARVDGHLLAGADTTVGLHYRFYRQAGASFFEARYPMPEGRLQFVTRDRELSPMSTHRVTVDGNRTMDLTAAGPPLRLSLVLGAALLAYEDFVGLDRVWALDGTVAGTVEL